MAASDSLKLAVFDLDGTLIDSATSIVESVRACWDACGFAVPEDRAVRRIIGLPWEESVRALLPDAGDGEFLKIRSYYDEVHSGARPRPHREELLFEGTLEVLDGLESAGYVLAVVTSRNGSRLPQLIETLDLEGRFVSVKTPDNGPGKPNPHLLLDTMSEIGVRAEDTVMIGDTTFDILMAVNAGTASIGVNWGVHEEQELRDAGADHVARAVADLPPAIHRLTGFAS